jgi:hypothetical protein
MREDVLFVFLERWPSGLRRTPGKCVFRVERDRGFESLSLRSNKMHLTTKTISVN